MNDRLKKYFQEQKKKNKDKDLKGKQTVIDSPYQVMKEKDPTSPAPTCWHIPRKDTRTYPKAFPDNYTSDKFSKFFQKKIVDGWEPKEKLFDEDSSIFTMGSCFAEHISKAMVKRKRELKIKDKIVNTLHVPSSVNNSFGITQFFEWALENKISDKSYWHDTDSNYVPSDRREKYSKWLKTSDGFVFTFGLSEIWKDLETDTVFWRAVPEDLYKKDKVRYKFELSTVEQNVEQIKKLIKIVRDNVGDVPIILTVSPVQLMATFRGVSAITANSVSKAILRVAVDQVMGENLENVYYWPSYEVFKETGQHIPTTSFGKDGVINHPNKPIIEKVVNAFFRNYYKS